MPDKDKGLRYTVDFVTALPPDACRARLERDDLPSQPVGNSLTPIQQEVIMQPDGTFVIERSYAAAIHPIRFVGSLDLDEPSGGTWVHGGVTHDTSNQVMIEGLLVFVVYFLLTAVLFIELRTRVFLLTGVLLILALGFMSWRWRALHLATVDLGRWVRRKLYVTAGQVK